MMDPSEDSGICGDRTAFAATPRGEIARPETPPLPAVTKSPIAEYLPLLLGMVIGGLDPIGPGLWLHWSDEGYYRMFAPLCFLMAPFAAIYGWFIAVLLQVRRKEPPNTSPKRERDEL
jgi:hypothetical protein